MPVIYDQGFNQNEIFVLIVLFGGIFLAWKCPSRFSRQETGIYLIYSVFVGILIDHSLGIPPLDYYDVNDSSNYEIMDFLTYFMYGPYGYLSIYIFDYFRLSFKFMPLYILFWALLGMAAELLAVYLGVFHYKYGYQFLYSFPIYLLVLTPNIMLYRVFNYDSSNNVKRPQHSD